ncbi:hypothetical protein [Kitasatospora sp. MBT63]|uniref:hypothetical protein n=1 Tax=Kitasatospora sp. MBT63 TaxID=1444768 RepID=UPI00053A0B62|nr:hypothetical protein [Kitasatospora sp. MBT63]
MSTTPAPTYYGRPRQTPSRPGDAERAPRELMDAGGQHREDRTWRLVHIRIGGRWRSGLLTVWRRPAGSAVWVAHVRWGEDLNWGWFIYDPATIRIAPTPPDEPAGPPPETTR